MIVALCLCKYFPRGGLQRDFMRIAETTVTRGHHARICTRTWQGECPAESECADAPVIAHSNHGRDKQYQMWVQRHLFQHSADRVLGFSKTSGLGYYYAAGVCYVVRVVKERGVLYRSTARYRHYLAFEQAVFKLGTKIKLLMLITRRILDFKIYYHMEGERLQLLPSGIYPDRKYSSQALGNRGRYREANGITSGHLLLSQVGSDFPREGVGRSAIAAAALPGALCHQAQLFVASQDKPRAFVAQVERMGVKESVHFSVGHDDVAYLMAAADALLHPAKQEATGIVLVEAITTSLSVPVMKVCGYAPHVAAARRGVTLSEPFEQHASDDGLHKALADNPLRKKRVKNTRHYADMQDPYSLPEHVVDIITGELHG